MVCVAVAVADDVPSEAACSAAGAEGAPVGPGAWSGGCGGAAGLGTPGGCLAVVHTLGCEVMSQGGLARGVTAWLDTARRRTQAVSVMQTIKKEKNKTVSNYNFSIKIYV